MAETSLYEGQPNQSCSSHGSPGNDGLLVDLLNGETRLPDHLGSAARGKDADILLVEALGQVQQTRLVIDREDGNLLTRHLCFGAFKTRRNGLVSGNEG